MQQPCSWLQHTFNPQLDVAGRSLPVFPCVNLPFILSVSLIGFQLWARLLFASNVQRLLVNNVKPRETNSTGLFKYKAKEGGILNE